MPRYALGPTGIFPATLNAASRKPVAVSSLCGASGGETFCQPGQASCVVASCVSGQFPAAALTDGNPATRWQAAARSQPVTATVNLRGLYQVYAVTVTFASSRPGAAVLERSLDGGITWLPYQRYADSCEVRFGEPTLTVDDAENPTDDICVSAGAGSGDLTFTVFDAGTKPEAITGELGESLRAFSLATHVRLRMLALVGDTAGSGTPTDQQYFSIRDLVVTGRLECHGHANSVTGANPTSCQCQHFTTGASCDACLATHNEAPFRRGTSFASNACAACQCNGHATTCTREAEQGSGVCESCSDNTQGAHCDTCVDGYFRREGVAISRTDACQPCSNCNSAGSVLERCVKDTFDSATLPPGACLCKAEWTGPNCDVCKPGFFLDGGACVACNCDAAGSTSSSCDAAGRCSCQPNAAGDKCDVCDDGFYKSDGACIACGCDTARTLGADPTCLASTGQCNCSPGHSGRDCAGCAEGFYRHPQTGECTACGCNVGEANSASCDDQGVCDCLPDSPFAGSKCDECKPGSTAQGQGCKPCDCNLAGSLSGEGVPLCDPVSGACSCKERVEGAKCSTCKEGFAGLDGGNALGCSGGAALRAQRALSGPSHCAGSEPATVPLSPPPLPCPYPPARTHALSPPFPACSAVRAVRPCGYAAARWLCVAHVVAAE